MPMQSLTFAPPMSPFHTEVPPATPTATPMSQKNSYIVPASPYRPPPQPLPPSTPVGSKAPMPVQQTPKMPVQTPAKSSALLAKTPAPQPKEPDTPIVVKKPSPVKPDSPREIPLTTAVAAAEARGDFVRQVNNKDKDPLAGEDFPTDPSMIAGRGPWNSPVSWRHNPPAQKNKPSPVNVAKKSKQQDVQQGLKPSPLRQHIPQILSTVVLAIITGFVVFVCAMIALVALQTPHLFTPVPVPFCDMQSAGKCIPCPMHAVCHGLTMECEEPYMPFGLSCGLGFKAILYSLIHKDSKTYDLVNVIKGILENRKGQEYCGEITWAAISETELKVNCYFASLVNFQEPAIQ